jgi:hypothetical protein
VPGIPSDQQVLAALQRAALGADVAYVSRFFRPDPAAPSADNTVLGVRMGKVFPIAKRFVDTPLPGIEVLLEAPAYEARMAAVSIMDFQARDRRTPPARRQALYDLYLRRHDRINNWDLVDRAAPFVVGGWLADKPRAPLYRLARSANPWERRTAIVSTWFFIRQDQLDDTFAIAGRLVGDGHELVQKAVGGWLREAGKRDPGRLTAFLDSHAAAMPRTMLRLAIERLGPTARQRYLPTDR